ncbi:hypothetical protein Mapa_003392 [Marchantia paleacea]|nr:hypothetical protein Mapa_003392 [Marchantia paleacea]
MGATTSQALLQRRSHFPKEENEHHNREHHAHSPPFFNHLHSLHDNPQLPFVLDDLQSPAFVSPNQHDLTTIANPRKKSNCTRYLSSATPASQTLD